MAQNRNSCSLFTSTGPRPNLSESNNLSIVTPPGTSARSTVRQRWPSIDRVRHRRRPPPRRSTSPECHREFHTTERASGCTASTQTRCSRGAPCLRDRPRFPATRVTVTFLQRRRRTKQFSALGDQQTEVIHHRFGTNVRP
mgnify:CR=1 FL=1